MPKGLLPDLDAWNESRGVEPSAWICMVGRFDHFLGYADLLWPDFLQFDGRVFVASFFDQQRYLAMLGGGAGPSEAQTFMNWLEISDLFGESGESPSDKLLLELGSRVQETWSAKLAIEYPSMQFDVFTSSSLDAPDGGELVVSFRQLDP